MMDMPEATEVLTTPITLTELAAGAVRDLLARRNLPGYALRIFISGGGCAGYQYGLALEGRVREEDFAFETHGVRVVIDEVSINYLRGATVDFSDELMGGGFKIHNPNAITTCNCGQSFQTPDSDAPGGVCARR